MEFTIIQKQTSAILKEQAKSSFNFTFLSRNEFYLALVFFTFGVFISLFNESTSLLGSPFMLIGGIEMLKFPFREKIWVHKKTKEEKYNKDFKFELYDDSLKVSVNGIMKLYHFEQMRKCLISETGILFKINWTEYYYISFQSFSGLEVKNSLISYLICHFNENKITIKNQTL